MSSGAQVPAAPRFKHPLTQTVHWALQNRLALPVLAFKLDGSRGGAVYRTAVVAWHAGWCRRRRPPAAGCRPLRDAQRAAAAHTMSKRLAGASRQGGFERERESRWPSFVHPACGRAGAPVGPNSVSTNFGASAFAATSPSACSLPPSSPRPSCLHSALAAACSRGCAAPIGPPRRPRPAGPTAATTLVQRRSGSAPG